MELDHSRLPQWATSLSLESKWPLAGFVRCEKQLVLEFRPAEQQWNIILWWQQRGNKSTKKEQPKWTLCLQKTKNQQLFDPITCSHTNALHGIIAACTNLLPSSHVHTHTHTLVLLFALAHRRTQAQTEHSHRHDLSVPVVIIPS